MTEKPCASCAHHKELFGQGICTKEGKGVIAQLMRRMGGCGTAGVWHIKK